jgi:hypothetical protein
MHNALATVGDRYRWRLAAPEQQRKRGREIRLSSSARGYHTVHPELKLFTVYLTD